MRDCKSCEASINGVCCGIEVMVTFKLNSPIRKRRKLYNRVKFSKDRNYTGFGVTYGGSLSCLGAKSDISDISLTTIPVSLVETYKVLTKL